MNLFGTNSLRTTRRFWLLIALTVVALFTVGQPASASPFPLPDTAIMTPDQLEEGMTGYGKTVFYGQSIDTFGVRVVGVLENAMPDQDFIIIEANHPLLKETKIMSGMSGSPIFINGKLIGALAYSWSFAKESLAGVTPIKNMLAYRDRNPDSPPGNSSFERIATPLVASGFSNDLQTKLKRKLEENGFKGRMIASGQSDGSSGDDPTGSATEELTGGSAVGIQLMRGDLSLTAIGTVTYRHENSVYAFGHPFMSSGNTRFPMTSADVITPMPSLQSSFKLASAERPVGVIQQDRQAAVVGETGDTASMVPVDINLSSPAQNLSDSYSIEVVRNKYLSPGLINMAAANFAKSKISQLGLNRVESTVELTLKNQKDLKLGTTSITSQNFDPWAFLPISSVWNNQFEQIDVEKVSIHMTMKPEQEWASIEDVWLNSNALNPGELATVYVRLSPYRNPSVVRKIKLEVPESVPGSKARLVVLPASELIALQARPETSGQLIEYLNSFRKDSQLAVVLQIPRYAMDAAGHDLPEVPYSISGAYQRAHNSTVTFKPGAVKNIVATPWVLQGQQTLTLPLKME